MTDEELRDLERRIEEYRTYLRALVTADKGNKNLLAAQSKFLLLLGSRRYEE